LIHELKKQYTIVIVTHNMQQAARVSDYTAFMYMGRLIEFGKTDKLFTAPENKKPKTTSLAGSAEREVAHCRYIQTDIRRGVATTARESAGNGWFGREADWRRHVFSDRTQLHAGAGGIGRDHTVNYLDVAVDEASTKLLALHQPAGRDLRFIMTSIRISTDLERVGDIAQNIANARSS